MPVVDLQLWADNLEDIRLPEIESDILTNELEIDARVQELSTLIANNVAATTTAQNTADTADALATTTHNSFVGQEVILKAYADAAAQASRAQFQQIIDDLTAQWTTTVQNDVTTYVDGYIPTISADNAATIAEIETLKLNIESYSNSYATSLNDLLNVQVPALQTDVAGAQSTADAAQNDFTLFKASYGYATLSEGLANIRAENEQNLAPLGVKVLRGPRSLWGKDIEDSTLLVRATLGIYGTFVTDDTDMGECFEFGDTSESSIGAAFPVSFSPNRVYKIRAKAKISTVASDVALGVSAYDLTTNTFGGSVPFTASTMQLADGVVERQVYVSTNEQMMIDYGVPAADRIVITGSAAASKLYSYVVQNSGNLTSGLIRVGEIEVVDVTEVLSAVQEVKTSLTATIDGNTAAIDDVLALSTTPETAFATMLSELSVDAQGTIAGITNFGTTMADLNGNAGASYVMRAKAGGAAGEVEISAFADAEGGAASVVNISADVMTFNGGVAMFGGVLQSANYDPGLTGWALFDDGQLEIRNLIEREALNGGEVNTDWMAEHATTIPLSQSAALNSIGDGSYLERQWLNITLDYPGRILVIWNGSQSYTFNATFKVSIHVNSVLREERIGATQENCPTIAWASTNQFGAGTHRVGIHWEGSSSDMTLDKGTLIIMGIKK